MEWNDRRQNNCIGSGQCSRTDSHTYNTLTNTKTSGKSTHTHTHNAVLYYIVMNWITHTGVNLFPFVLVCRPIWWRCLLRVYAHIHCMHDWLTLLLWLLFYVFFPLFCYFVTLFLSLSRCCFLFAWLLLFVDVARHVHCMSMNWRSYSSTKQVHYAVCIDTYALAIHGSVWMAVTENVKRKLNECHE